MLILSMIPPASRRVRSDASREVCRAHLAQIGRAMLLYANDHGGKLPQPGGRNGTWGRVYRWDAPARYLAFGCSADDSGGKASITSAFYLLVKYGQLHPKDFICPGDVGSTEFKLSDLPELAEGFGLSDAWDFGPDAPRHCSYAYQVPFGAARLVGESDPRLPIAGDRSPWFLGPAGEPGPFALFKPDPVGTQEASEAARRGNSPSHGRDGQNVLFVDGHVSFEKRSDCGLHRDNIYTVATLDRGGSPVGVLPTYVNYMPAHSKDSLLIHDPVAYADAPPAQAKEVDSKDLKETAVVATLACPLAEHKNAIWCSTFQMAWDKFTDDVVGEPIRMPGAEDLAGRLNQGTFPTADIETRSYYANAGFVKDGIIEQIQKDMASRFPDEEAPTFDPRYTHLPQVALTYAYLNVDVGFAHPYYVNDRPFVFNASGGGKTNVTSFSTSAPNVNNTMVRGQVDILHYEFGDTPDGDEFIVDLSIHTKPYQIILARMPKSGTLGETRRVLQERITKFKDDPDYAALSKLRPIDSLTVPDVLYKLTHHFDQLLEKPFANKGWKGFSLFEALQRIDFSLSRTGVVLKSVAIGGATASRSPQQLAKPRHLRFDRPFLICVKKREPDATPFFLMWVDNAELMQRAPEKK